MVGPRENMGWMTVIIFAYLLGLWVEFVKFFYKLTNFSLLVSGVRWERAEERDFEVTYPLWLDVLYFSYNVFLVFMLLKKFWRYLFGGWGWGGL